MCVRVDVSVCEGMCGEGMCVYVLCVDGMVR